MKKHTKLVSPSESNVRVIPPFTDEEIEARHKEYETQPIKKFDIHRKDKAFTPVIIDDGVSLDEIQYNFCNDTFCPNYGAPMTMIKNRKSRSVRNYVYTKSDSPAIACNIMEYVGSPTRVDNNKSILLSNWSLAEEIKRLQALEDVVCSEKEYTFHYEKCPNAGSPTSTPKEFMKHGKTSSGAVRYRCKECGKTTAIEPSVEKSFNYRQKRNDVLVSLMQDVLSHTPVRKVCLKNNISPDTYYRKVEWLYRKCLEFLKRHEIKLSALEFDDLYLTTDSFTYSLNNIRKKGMGGKRQSPQEKANASESITSMFATCDIKSFYTFRADLCYDYHVSLDDVETDTQLYHCDHTYPYLRKNERLKDYSYAPQLPTKMDLQSLTDYQEERSLLEARKRFVDGIHVQRNYTGIAHYHLIKKRLNYKRLIIVSDDDKAIRYSAQRVFVDEFRNQEAFYFTAQYEKNLSLQEAYAKSAITRNDLKKWAVARGLRTNSLYDMAYQKLCELLPRHDFYEANVVNGMVIYGIGNNPIEHPLPSTEEGSRLINLVSYNPYVSSAELAQIILNANTRAVDNFFQELRRHVNTLERPLVGGRGEKAYIYANYNPKYAHQLITIFRTYYNFIKTRKYYDKKIMTPAQRIGIADKAYNFKDIVYFR